jgi:hypothetical protein
MTTRPIYWLDANVLIESSKGPYQFDIAPGFWSALEDQAKAGRVCVPKMVYDEIVGDGPKDHLAQWLKLRKSQGFCVGANKEVQTCLKQVADHVIANYGTPYASEFLRVADPWLVAHAMECKGVVVTFETKSLGPGRVKIPNVCCDLHVPSISLYKMLSDLGIRFK